VVGGVTVQLDGVTGRVWTTGEHNVERRRFVLGVGALAAGGAAAMESGAFTQATATRQVESTVLDDTEGYMSFVVDDSEVANGQYATLNKDGEVVLLFTGEAGTNPFDGPVGQRVNTNSVYYFDDVFGIANQGQDESFTLQIEFNSYRLSPLPQGASETSWSERVGRGYSRTVFSTNTFNYK
jgi:hypothetical protein